MAARSGIISETLWVSQSSRVCQLVRRTCLAFTCDVVWLRPADFASNVSRLGKPGNWAAGRA